MFIEVKAFQGFVRLAATARMQRLCDCFCGVEWCAQHHWVGEVWVCVVVGINAWRVLW
jgi:hypothetical protein